MMRVHFELTDISGIVYLRELAHNAPEKLMRVLEKVGRDTINEAKRSMQESPQTGKLYRHGGVDHIASSPGFPPRPDTGNLMSGLNFDTGRFWVDVGATAEYAPWLEVGTRRMAPRPWLRPAMEKVVTDLEDSLSEVFGK